MRSGPNVLDSVSQNALSALAVQQGIAAESLIVVFHAMTNLGARPLKAFAVQQSIAAEKSLRRPGQCKHDHAMLELVRV